jgi:hypothetical protein
VRYGDFLLVYLYLSPNCIDALSIELYVYLNLLLKFKSIGQWRWLKMCEIKLRYGRHDSIGHDLRDGYNSGFSVHLRLPVSDGNDAISSFPPFSLRVSRTYYSSQRCSLCC